MFTIQCRSCQSEIVVKKIPKTGTIACASCNQSNKIEAEASYFPSLIGIQGENKGKEFPFGDILSMGREATNTILIKEAKVSRRHAQITFLEGSYHIEDLQSGNGTFLNGFKITKSRLQDKDLIRIAEGVYMFRNPYRYSPGEEGEKGKDGGKKEAKQPSDAVLTERSSSFASTDAELKFDAERSFLMESKEIGSVVQLEKANAKLRILYEVNHAISSIFDLQELFNAILDLVFKYMTAERGAILLYDPEKDSLQVAVTKIRDHKEKETEQLKISKTMMARVLKEKVSLLTTDALADNNFAGAQSIISQGIRCAMSVPLISKEHLFGVLHIDTTRKVSEFNQDTLELLTGIAGQAATTIENAKLLEKIEKEIETRGHLQRYLSSELVEQIINKQLDLKIGGQLKKATTLFTDVRGFTRLTENIGAEAIVTILNNYFTRMVDVIFSNKGTLDKFIGDAIMAVWGIPVEHPADSSLAVMAAVEMQKELFYFNLFQKKNNRPKLKMGAGINTGEVVVGNMGSPKRMEYTVIGPPVNLASRVECLTSYNQILITENTYHEIKDKLVEIERPPTSVKGIDRPITTFGIVAIRDEHDLLHFFLPVIVNVGTGPEPGYEGLITNYKANKADVQMEPLALLKVGDTVTFHLDIPDITPVGTVSARVCQTKQALHGQDEYLAVAVEIDNIPENVQKFLHRIFPE